MLKSKGFNLMLGYQEISALCEYLEGKGTTLLQAAPTAMYSATADGVIIHTGSDELASRLFNFVLEATNGDEPERKRMKAWTDYPFYWMGDTSEEEAPIREVDVLSYDGDKYCLIIVGGVETEIKAKYLYLTPGRYGEVRCVPLCALNLLPME